jgi:hypothetical protein
MTRFIGVGMDEKFTGGVTFIYIYIYKSFGFISSTFSTFYWCGDG